MREFSVNIHEIGKKEWKMETSAEKPKKEVFQS